jgi:hypothetical protein
MSNDKKFMAVIGWCEKAIAQSGQYEWYASLTDKEKHDVIMAMVNVANKAIDKLEEVVA